MRVVIINRSDHLGGAAIASSRLAAALRQQGVDARMLVADRGTEGDHVAIAGSAFARKKAFLTERWGIYWRNGRRRDTLFKIDTATHGLDVSRHPWVREADVIVLGWVNQGMLSLADVERLGKLGKPLVWVMHDMWNCTGLCHHAYECEAYHARCRACPLLGTEGDDLSTLTQARKATLYRRTTVQFVAVSQWLASCCQNSSLLRDKPVTVIGNPFAAGEFDWHRATDNPYGVAPGSKVFVMGAARLDDPVKGMDLLIAALRHLAQERHDVLQRMHLVLYGHLRDQSLLEQLPVAHTHLGYVTDVETVYRHADVVLSTSRYESCGYTLAEGMACGCVPVTTGQGGQVDIVRHLHDGYVTGSVAPADIARGIVWATVATLSRQVLHDTVAARFDAPIVAARFMELFKELITKKQ